MNQSERDALRKKHTPFIDIDFGECCSWCCAGDEYPSIPYPCDTIKVLDAWEAETYRGVVPPEVASRLAAMGFDGDGFDFVEKNVILHDPEWKGQL